MEVLETRELMDGKAIAGALGLPGVSVNDFSQPNAISISTDIKANGLLGFPTGSDDKYVVLSTGDATRINTPAGYSKTGTDWSSKGAVADNVSLVINAPVPAGAHRLKLDFMFLTQEEPSATNLFNDSFKVTANAGMGGGDETLVDYTVNNLFYTGSVAGTIFKHRTLLLSMNYQVPVGATNINLQMTLLDEHDGKGDTAVLLDNLRFESTNKVFLNFEGGTTGALGPGIALTMPAFQVSDLGYPAGTDRATIINEIVNEVTAKYAAFDVSFATTQPTSGDFTTIIIGGSNNNTVTLGADANPLLVRKFGASTTYKAFNEIGVGSFEFGRALDGVDIGNKKLNDTTVVFPQSFASFYSTDSAATREDRMVVTIAHELGHALGLRHIASSNVNDPNIMKQRSPRSSTATFEDLSRALAESWADGVTEQNNVKYLSTTLGPAGGNFVGLGFSPQELVKWVIATIPFFNSGGIYNAYLGVIPGQPLDSDEAELANVPQIFHVGDLTGDELLQIPVTSTADKLVFWGQSTPNGPVDIFSGQQTGGELDFADSGVPLFDGSGKLMTSMATSFGDPSVGPLTDGPALGVTPSAFTRPLLPFGTYQDAQGDSYTIKLTSKTGVGGFTMIDPDGDGKGPIDEIVLQDTTIKDKLAITVKKPTKAQLAAGLDGRVDVGSIKGSTLGSIDAKSSDLTGAGVEFGNLLGSLAVRDVLNGADISIGGGETVKTKITARVVGDGTDIVSRSTISALTAVAIGDGKIDAPAIGTLKVTGDKKAAISGDFRSDISLAHSTPFLTLTMIKKSLLGSATIAGIVEGSTIDVDGPVGTFKAARFVNSILDVASFLLPAKLGSFTASGIKGSPLAAFDNSTIVANIIGSVKLGTIDTDNGGVPFGVIATDSFGTVTGTLLPGGTKFKFDKKNPAAQGSGDFVVKLDFGL